MFRHLLPLPCAVLLGLSPGAEALHAQSPEWDVEGEVGASLFFGNTSQTIVNTRFQTERADSVYEVSTGGSFGYGHAENEEGERFVVKRAWNLEASFDWQPYGVVSPFLFGEGSSSYERRIDFRYNLGGGGKYTFIRDDRSRVDLSVALLAEQTFVRDDAAMAEDVDESVLARWSTRFRARREFGPDGVTIGTTNFYRPVFGAYGNYVLESESSLSYDLSEVVTLKLSFLDTYDSRAVTRGADSNNDGRLLFSVLGSF